MKLTDILSLKQMGYTDALKVSITKNEFLYWIANSAYK